MPMIEKIEKIEVHQLPFAMTSACNSEAENASERFPHRSSALTRALLSRVVRTTCESFVPEDWSSQRYHLPQNHYSYRPILLELI